MKILLVGNYENDQQRSMLGFAHALETGLKARNLDVRLIAPRPVLGKLFPSRPANAGIKKWLGYFDKFVIFPWQLRLARSKADLVHVCDHSNSFYVRYLQKMPHLVTCHDMLAIQSALGEFEHWKTGPSGRFFQRSIVNGLKKARFIVCVSENTRRELERIARVPHHKTAVVYNGLYQDYSALPLDQSQPLLQAMGIEPEQDFLLHVGSNQFYKNRMGVLKIFRALRDKDPQHGLKLVMAGRPWTSEMREFVVEHEMGNEVLELANLSHEQLRALYSQAKAFVFPSFYEGFGLPIIEAQSCSCPVFTSNRAPMTEVGAKSARYFDPDQPEQAAQLILDTLQTDEQTMIEAGLENVKRFSTQNMIDGYIGEYKKLLA